MPHMPRISWDEAFAALYEMLPTTRDRFTARNVSVDTIVKCAREENRVFTIQWLVKVLNLRGEWWHNRDHVPEEHIFDTVFSAWDFSRIPGNVIVILDDSFEVNEEISPYEIPASSLRQFMLDYEIPRRAFFDGDTIFFFRDIGVISVVHDEGVFCHIDCTNEVLPPPPEFIRFVTE